MPFNSSIAKIYYLHVTHSKVDKVHYPFLASHPQHELAKKQMKQGGGLFSIQLKTEKVADVEETKPEETKE